MLYDAGFATRGQVKAMLELGNSTTFDSLLDQIIKNVSGGIEAAAGRPLLRRHALTERFGGGCDVIRVSTSPIAKIHSIRESEDRDFENSANYEELVEGTDYILDAESDGKPAGWTGAIRRLNGKWMGGVKNPGQVQVIYSGGYKTDDEANNENSSITVGLNSGDDASDFSLIETIQSTPGYLIRGVSEEEQSFGYQMSNGEPYDRHYRAFFKFNLGGVYVPTWRATKVTLSLGLRVVGGTGVWYWIKLLSCDPNTKIDNDLAGLYELASAEVESDFTNVVGVSQLDRTTLTAFTFSLSEPTGEISPANDGPMASLSQNVQALLAAFNAMAAEHGYVAFSISRERQTENLIDCYMASHLNSVGSLRPNLTIYHTPILSFDPFTVPYDLRRACILQAAHEFKARATVGFTKVTTKVGVGHEKPAVSLLPEVEAIALSYRRLY